MNNLDKLTLENNILNNKLKSEANTNSLNTSKEKDPKLMQFYKK